MSRPRRAAGSWPTREPEIEEPEPRWASLTDTGSMAPSDEALAWQRRADDWAQQAEVEPYGGGGQAIEPANRWSSEVTPTGRPTFPADGVGWRTETAEWRATGARWRQTTEWRSSTGSHVWRSTTEAWRAEDEAAERDKSSIPGTAWETGSDRETPSWRQSPAVEQSGTTPSWRQPAAETPSWRRTEPDTSSSWQRRPDLPAATTPVEQTPSWRQPSTQMPTWQQPSTQTPAGQTPSWQQPQQTPSWQQPSTPAAQTPSWQQPSAQAPQTPSWQQPSASTPQTPSWQQPSASTPQTPSWQEPQTPSRRRAADTGTWSTAASTGSTWSDQARPGPGENTTGLTRWERTDAPGWQRSAAEDARHLVREDDRAAWRQDAGYGDRPTRVGRRRAAEADPAPSGGSGWSSGSSADNWADHTDTGSIPLVHDQDEPAAWGARSEAPSRRDRRRQVEEARPEPARPEPAARRTAGAERRRYNANTTNWREDTASWDADQDTSNWTRDPDTGQWSRAEDDPRVLAWRAEAARREAMKAEPEAPGRRTRRDEPVGGVPGGPLPSSSIPAGNTSGAGWSAGSAPGDEGRSGRRGRPDEPFPTDGYSGGRRRATEPSRGAEPPWAAQPPRTAESARAAAEPLNPQAWQAAPEPRQSRQYRRLNPDPDGYGEPGHPGDGARPGSGYPGDGARSGSGYPGEGTRSGPDYPGDGGRPGNGYPREGGRPGPTPPQWSEPAEPEPRRRAYRDEPAAESPRWQDTGYGGDQRGLPPDGGYGQSRPESPRSGFGSAARELTAGPSAQPQRPAYGGGQRELPAGPSAPQQQPVYGARELPAAPSGAPSWADQERRQRPEPQRPASGQSWLDEERQQRQAPQRQPYGGGPASETSWLDQERRQQPQRGPAYGGPGIPAQPSSYDVPPEQQRRPGFGSARALPAGTSAPTSGPAWTEQQKPAYGNAPVSDDLSARWPDPLTDTSSRRGRGDRDDPPPPSGGGLGDRPPLADWLAAERAGRRGADYRGAGQDGETDWRRELSRQNELAEGESRRYDTSDFPPFRPSGSAAVDGSSNLALSATSVITAPGAAGAGGVAVEEDTSWPPRRGAGAFQGTGSYERRPMGGDFLLNKQNDLLATEDEEEEQEDTGTPLAAVGYTVVWYGVPVVLFVLGIFLVNSGQNGHALDTLADAAPGFGIALVLSMMVAYGLRTVTTAWKSASVGLAAAVVGGGLATVLSSAITGNSLS
ncbi:hypothetical protein BC793_12696 [Actinoplanes xinjiangensis]|uniref:Uncharacterized protein n=2 Tax=Actinoplanes xinjiangensis TaxID=512350 RepID=A0A316EQH2_9ACTN|nr:hypothetical protein BC793_12696 [Actinoplanes xinjiangensis]